LPQEVYQIQDDYWYNTFVEKLLFW